MTVEMMTQQPKDMPIVVVTTKKQLQEKLLSYNEMWLAFDEFLIEELGEETYMDLSREFGIKQAKKFLKDMGVSDEEIADFTGTLEEKNK